MPTPTVVVHFKHTLADKVKNLFRKKAQRFPAVATFTGFDHAHFSAIGGLKVVWGDTQYHYPPHTIKRVKLHHVE